ncbi:MAG: carbon-nitrogen hydrolase [Planctomycetota bacterium]|nr:carbon-nitrogen hydrolase [Planctomycetota bacterium]
MDCRVLLVQTNPRLGDLHANLQSHVESIEAGADQADLIVFPELSLTGYFLQDQVFELGLRLDAPEVAQLVELSSRVSIAFGFVEKADDGRFYNSLAFAEDGDLIGVHRKVHLVSYGMFDEARDFGAGERFAVIESKHGRFGPLICEDIWHVPSSYVHFMNNADALVVASASPARGVEAPGPGLGSQRVWNTMLAAAAMFYRTWVLYASRVGWEDGVSFSGGSCVFDPFGEELASIEGLDPGELSARITSAVLDRARYETPLRRDEKPWILQAELARLTGLEPGEPEE